MGRKKQFNEAPGFTENIVAAQSIFPVLLNFPHLMSEKTLEVFLSVSRNSGDILRGGLDE